MPSRERSQRKKQQEEQGLVPRPGGAAPAGYETWDGTPPGMWRNAAGEGVPPGNRAATSRKRSASSSSATCQQSPPLPQELTALPDYNKISFPPATPQPWDSIFDSPTATAQARSSWSSAAGLAESQPIRGSHNATALAHPVPSAHLTRIQCPALDEHPVPST